MSHNQDSLPLLLHDTNLNFALTIRKLSKVKNKNFSIFISKTQSRPTPVVDPQSIVPPCVVECINSPVPIPDEWKLKKFQLDEHDKIYRELGILPVCLDIQLLSGNNIIASFVKEDLIIENKLEPTDRSISFKYPRVVIFLMENANEMFWLSMTGNLNKVTNVYIVSSDLNTGLVDKLSYFKNVHVYERISWNRLKSLVEGSDAYVGYFSCATIFADLFGVPGMYYLPDYCSKVLHEHWSISPNNDLKPVRSLDEIENGCYEFISSGKWTNRQSITKKTKFNNVYEMLDETFNHFNKSNLLVIIETPVDEKDFHDFIKCMSSNNLFLDSVDIVGYDLSNSITMGIIKSTTLERPTIKLRFISMEHKSEFVRNKIYDIVVIFTSRSEKTISDLLSDTFLITRANSKILVKSKSTINHNSLELLEGLHNWYKVKR